MNCSMHVILYDAIPSITYDLLTEESSDYPAAMYKINV